MITESLSFILLLSFVGMKNNEAFAMYTDDELTVNIS